MSGNVRPQAYLKSSCPFCFKFVMFMAEAQLMDRIEIVRIDASNQEEMNHYRQLLQEQTGTPASFPTVEIRRGEYLSDSDVLIDYFAGEYGVDATALPGLAYYKANLLPAYRANFAELKALKEARQD